MGGANRRNFQTTGTGGCGQSLALTERCQERHYYRTGYVPCESEGFTMRLVKEEEREYESTLHPRQAFMCCSITPQMHKGSGYRLVLSLVPKMNKVESAGFNSSTEKGVQRELLGVKQENFSAPSPHLKWPIRLSSPRRRE